ncbi:MAG: MgtC/SapB family protein [Acidobacteria bacterium]|nr:MgtC/SapB family protein [Acidobacteriota bacterium]
MGFLPSMDLTPGILIKLVLASVLGGLVGLERELHGKPAGLRTNMFICAGSALFTILSEMLAARAGGDATRIASQLIPGIGFIGAGSIIRSRGSVQGLTTAATIFVMASIGMAVGGSFYWTAVFATVMMVLALSLLGWTERRFALKRELRHYRACGPEPDLLTAAVMEIVQQQRLSLHRLSSRRRDNLFELSFDVETSSDQNTAIVRHFTEKKFTCDMSLAGLEEGE